MSPPVRHAFVLALAGIVVLGACSDGGSTEAGSSTTTRPDASVTVTAGLVGVSSAGPPVELPAVDRDAVLAAVTDYVQQATLDPLDGAPTKDLAAQLTASAVPALTGPEHDALVDVGVPPATGAVKVTLAPVNLRGLADRAGTIDLVGATVDLTAHAPVAKGRVTIHRTGELMFTREGAAWKLLSFKLTVTRDGPGLDSATASTTPTAAP